MIYDIFFIDFATYSKLESDPCGTANKNEVV